MFVLRITGSNVCDLYALAVGDDYIYGDPQLLAYWNGLTWSRAATITNNPAIDIKTQGSIVNILHRQGDFTTMNDGRMVTRSLWPGHEITVNDFATLCSNSVIVGNSGLIIRCTPLECTVFQGPADENFISACCIGNQIIIGSQSGNLHAFDGTQNVCVARPCTGVITSLRANANNLLIGTSYDYSRNTGTVFIYDPMKGRVESEFIFKSGITRAVARSDSEIYASSPSEGIYMCSPSGGRLIWSNIMNSPPLFHNVTKLGSDIIAYGNGIGLIDASSVVTRLSPLVDI